MGVISNWAVNRGIGLSEDLFCSLLGLQSFEAMVSEKLDLINQKLDILIAAPFRQARMHLLEGNIEKCKDKLIESISLNELDLPAIALYSLLLYKSGNVSLALDYFESIIRKFGPHQGLVSGKLIDIYSKHIDEGKPLQNIQPFHIQLEPSEASWYPAEIDCTLSSIIIKWKTQPGLSWEGGTYTGRHRQTRIAIYDWTGKRVMDFEPYSDEISILAITEEYVVVLIETGLFFSKKELKIFRTKDGSQVVTPSTPSTEQIAKLFFADQRFSLKAQSYHPSPPIQLLFAGAKISEDKYSREKIHIEAD